MKKLTLLLLIISTCISTIPSQIQACSSFAVYTDKPVYGMNFDYQNFPMKFVISESNGIKTFHLAFQRPVNGMLIWANTAGMNDKGLFASCQEELPNKVQPAYPKEGGIYIHQLYNKINELSSTSEIEEICETKRLIQLPAVSVHNMFADKYGNALITEAGEEGNSLIKNRDNYLVMANFANRSLEGKDYSKAKGIGDYRYIIGHEYIKKQINNFSIEKGLDLLDKMHNTNPDCPTSCSMVFSPDSNEIFIVLKRDFSKIFRVSLEDSTIEAYQGFKNQYRERIGSKGILISSLIALK